MVTPVALVPKKRTKMNPTWDDSSASMSLPSASPLPLTPQSVGTIRNIQTPFKQQTRKRVNPKEFIKVKPMSSNEDEWWDI